MTTADLISNLERLGDEFLTVIQPLVDEQAIRVAQAQFLGKKGRVSELMKELGKLPAGDRPQVGAAANKVKADDRGAGREAARRAGRRRGEARPRAHARHHDAGAAGRPAVICTCSPRCGSRR